MAILIVDDNEMDRYRLEELCRWHEITRGREARVI